MTVLLHIYTPNSHVLGKDMKRGQLYCNKSQC